MLLDRTFGLFRNHTTAKKEILAGVTTFLTMAYIIVVNPAILSVDFAGQPTGLDFGAIVLATCLGAALTSIAMGLFTNYPIALAPGMGENFFFISVIMALTTMGFVHAWQTALGIVFISGLLFLLVSIVGIRERIIDAVSPSLRNGIAVGIGLFITFIGFQHGTVIVDKPGTMVGLNTHFISADMAVFFLGLIVTSVLWVRGVKGAILWGMVASAILALSLGQIRFQGIIGFPQIHQTAIFQMDLATALTWVCWPFIMVFLFMDVFDNIGTLIGVAETAGFMHGNKLPRANRVLIVDSLGTVAGACLGTSTVTSYIESVTGVAYGGRTGLVSVTVGALFLLALMFGPLIDMIGRYPPITAPALIIVGVMMMQNVRKIDWHDYSEGIPAFLTMIGIPLCYSIADGLALGFITYPIIKFFSGRAQGVGWLNYVMAGLLLAYFIFIRARLG